MTTTRKKLLVIGNGMTTTRFLEHMIKKGKSAFDISVFGDEPHPGYNRILLSPLLSGEQQLEDIITHPLDWYRDNAIELKSNTRISAIDCVAKKITDESGNIYPYDALVIATGSQPFLPDLPGNKLKGVFTYRTIDDVQAMLDITSTAKHAVVIGGGLLGLEVAHGLNTHGLNVTVCHRGPVLMERQLDCTASDFLGASLESRNITIRTDANTIALDGDETVEKVMLEDGTELPADIVVFAVGIRPSIQLAKTAGVECDNGIVVDDHMQGSVPGIFALGECAQHRGQTYGLVAPLYEQAEVCARYLCEDKSVSYQGSVLATSLKVTGINLFSAGHFNKEEGCQVMQLQDPANFLYRKLVFKQRRLVGALLLGDVVGASWYRDLIGSDAMLEHISEQMIYGEPDISEQVIEFENDDMADANYA